ncbi:MAG: ABC transporter substrate-binding protein [Mycobacterium sp.]|uniref:ABC transporter substrate-binding protein n=1 Tax=Mycobacterium sp. TaxID=1785 RepID=UPI00260B24C1|nr:ABC transporter substrate-binding protein [Mycobacterium sp.]MDI3314029.1 ABC transporter substrate-binding protein [Mycobacterium sp.]
MGLAVADCDQILTFSAPPRRVVILNPAIADILLDLGVGDRIIAQSGTAGLAKPLPRNAAAMDRVPVLSAHGMTSTAALLGVAPDLVISDESMWLNPKFGGASPQQLHQARIKTYIAVSGCGDGTRGQVADVFTDIDNYGVIFGRRDRAMRLVRSLQARLADIEARVGGQPKVPVFEFYKRRGGQFFNTAVGIAEDALDKSGGVSVFPDATGMKLTSKEAITARNPQALIELVEPGNPVDPVKEGAALRRAFPTTGAAQNGRIYFLGVAEATSPGTPRIIDGIAARAKWLHPEVFGPR